MRKQLVTPEQFVDLVLARMQRGMSYDDASAPYTTDVETEPARTADGVREVNESSFVDGEDNILAYLEQQGYVDGRYEAIGWQTPPDDPMLDMEERISEAYDMARRKVLYAAIRELSKQEQAVIHAIFWDDKPQAVIARGLGISRQAVNSAYQRALAKLREAYGLPADVTAPRRVRLTQDEMDMLVLARQRRHGQLVEARLSTLGRLA